MNIISINALPEVSTATLGQVYFLTAEQTGFKKANFYMVSEDTDHVKYYENIGSSDPFQFNNTKAIEQNTAAILTNTNTIQNEVITVVNDLKSFIKQVNTVVAVEQLPDLSQQASANAGKIYLLTGNQEGYIRTRFYQLVDIGGVLSYVEFQVSSFPPGVVKNVRFSVVSNILNLKWQDPDDTVIDGSVISKWGQTKVVYKVFDETTPAAECSYPSSPADGTTLVTTTIRNQYNVQSYTGSLLSGKVYYFRFFPYNNEGVYAAETEKPTDNRFKTTDYSWQKIQETLENFETEAGLLPEAGSSITINYLYDDYCTVGGSTVYTNTKQLVIDNEANLSTIPIECKVLGYNCHVPQYIKYRRWDDVTSKYIYRYVSSIDDTTEDVTIYKLDSTTTTRNVITGNSKPRTIAIGVKLYTKSYNTSELKNLYTGANETVIAVGSSNFTYGTGTSAYTAPKQITASDNNVYTFCGYCMSLNTDRLLAGRNTASYSNIQFDAPEALYAQCFNSYPTIETTSTEDYGYFWKDTNGCYHAINIVGEGLGGQKCQKYTSEGTDYQVYRYDATLNRMVLASVLFKKGYTYKINTTDGGSSYVAFSGGVVDTFKYRYPYAVGEFVYYPATSQHYKVIKALDAANSTINPTNTTYFTTSKASFQFNTAYSVNDVIIYPTTGKKYKVLIAITADNTTIDPTDTSYFQDQGYYYTTDTIIPTDASSYGYAGGVIVTENHGDRKNNGCNIYSQSNYRQYANSRKGYGEGYWVAQNEFDTNTTGNDLCHCNGFLLKLYKEAGLLNSVIPVVLCPQVATGGNNQYHTDFTYIGGEYHEYVVDEAFPMSAYEISLGQSSVDALKQFTECFFDNTSRQKYTVTSTGGKGGASYWWLRSPDVGNSYVECVVFTSGTLDGYYAYISGGFSPAFVIG